MEPATRASPLQSFGLWGVFFAPHLSVLDQAQPFTLYDLDMVHLHTAGYLAVHLREQLA